MRDNERAALDAAREACRANQGQPVGFLCGVFSMTMMLVDSAAVAVDPATPAIWRMSATPLPPNREMGPADWQLLDDALVYVGVPAGTKTEEAGVIRHWRWTAEPSLHNMKIPDEKMMTAARKAHEALAPGAENEDPDHE